MVLKKEGVKVATSKELKQHTEAMNLKMIEVIKKADFKKIDKEEFINK